MHEMSLMAEIIQLVSNDAKLHGFQKVSRIDVIVGDLSNVLPDALELAYSYFQKNRADLIDGNTELHILREVAKARCEKCQIEFEPDYRIALCPTCGLHTCQLISGETFRVESYEGEGSGESEKN